MFRFIYKCTGRYTLQAYKKDKKKLRHDAAYLIWKTELNIQLETYNTLADRILNKVSSLTCCLALYLRTFITMYLALNRMLSGVLHPCLHLVQCWNSQNLPFCCIALVLFECVSRVTIKWGTHEIRPIEELMYGHGTASAHICKSLSLVYKSCYLHQTSMII